MLGGQGLGFRQDDQVFEFQIIVQLHLFLGQEPRFLFLGDQSPDSLDCNLPESLRFAKIFTADGADGTDSFLNRRERRERRKNSSSLPSFASVEILFRWGRLWRILNPRNPRNPRFNSFWLRLCCAGLFARPCHCRPSCGLLCNRKAPIRHARKRACAVGGKCRGDSAVAPGPPAVA